MANRPKGFGMTAECEKKKAAKFDPDLTTDVLHWMALVLEDGGHTEDAATLMKIVDKGVSAPPDFVNPLKNGQILCKVMNVIKPKSVARINGMNQSFKQMENINNFIEAAESVGCKKMDLFQTVDLFESQNVPQVVNGIVSVGRKAQTLGYDGPALGPSEAQENKRDFTEEQLEAGKNIIGLQAGSNQGASQSGMNFGKARSIID